MTEEQFAVVVRFFERKAEKVSTVDDHEGEPWHIALKALTGDYQDITRFELVQSVRTLACEFLSEATLLYRMTRQDGYEFDAIQYGIIALTLEMAEQMAAVGSKAEEIAA